MLIHLHIGIDKAGSSAIQSNMKLNRDWFHKQSVFIPNTGLTNTGYWELFRELDDDSFSKLHGELERASAYGFDQAFMSWEGINTYTNQQITTLKTRLDRYNIKIYVYLREQSEIIQSGYFQQVKTVEQRLQLAEFHQNRTLLCPDSRDYAAMLDRFAAAFGEDAINVRVFDRDLLKNQNVVIDMLDMLQLEPDSEFKLSPGEDNPSLDIVSVKLMNLLDSINNNHQLLEGKAGLLTPVRQTLRSALSRLFPDPLHEKGESVLDAFCKQSAEGRKDIVDVLLNIIDMDGKVGKYFFTAADCEVVRNFYAQSNRDVVQRYFDESWSHPDLFPYSKPRTNDATTESVDRAIHSRIDRVLSTINHPSWNGLPLEGGQLQAIAKPSDGWSTATASGVTSTSASATIRFRTYWKHLNFTHDRLLLVVVGASSNDYSGSRVFVNGHELGVYDLRKVQMKIPLDFLQPLGLVDIRAEHQFTVDDKGGSIASEPTGSFYTLNSLKYGRRGPERNST